MVETIRPADVQRPTMSRRQFLRASRSAIGGGALSSLFLLRADTAVSKSPPFAIRQTAGANIGYTNLFVAQEAGILGKYGLNGPVRLFDVAYLGTEATLAGQADMSDTVEFPFLGFLAKGAKLVTVAVIDKSDDLKMVVRSAIQRPDDLRGRKIGLIYGSSAQYGFDRYTEHFGLGGAVKVINIDAADQVVTLVKGDIDGFIWVEPVVSRAFQVLGDKIHILSPSLAAVYHTHLYLIMLRDWAVKNRHHVEDYLRALIEANDFIGKHPRKTAEIVGKTLSLPPAKIPTLIKNAGFNWRVFLDRESVDNLKEAAAWMKAHGKIKTVPDIQGAVDPSFLKHVDRSAVTL